MDQLFIFAGNHPVLSAAWAAIVVMIIVTTIRIQMSPIKQISTQELTFLVNREEGVVVDIRTEKEFKTSRIIDSKNLVKEKVTNIAQESWVVIKGSVKCIFYDIDDTIIEEIILEQSDLSMTFRGGHNYEILEDDTVVYEFKTGPYLGIEFDKTFI